MAQNNRLTNDDNEEERKLVVAVKAYVMVKGLRKALTAEAVASQYVSNLVAERSSLIESAVLASKSSSSSSSSGGLFDFDDLDRVEGKRAAKDVEALNENLENQLRLQRDQAFKENQWRLRIASQAFAQGKHEYRLKAATQKAIRHAFKAQLRLGLSPRQSASGADDEDEDDDADDEHDDDDDDEQDDLYVTEAATAVAARPEEKGAASSASAPPQKEKENEEEEEAARPPPQQQKEEKEKGYPKLVPPEEEDSVLWSNSDGPPWGSDSHGGRSPESTPPMLASDSSSTDQKKKDEKKKDQKKKRGAGAPIQLDPAIMSLLSDKARAMLRRPNSIQRPKYDSDSNTTSESESDSDSETVEKTMEAVATMMQTILQIERRMRSLSRIDRLSAHVGATATREELEWEFEKCKIMLKRGKGKLTKTDKKNLKSLEELTEVLGLRAKKTEDVLVRRSKARKAAVQDFAMRQALKFEERSGGKMKMIDILKKTKPRRRGTASAKTGKTGKTASVASETKTADAADASKQSQTASKTRKEKQQKKKKLKK